MSENDSNKAKIPVRKLQIQEGMLVGYQMTNDYKGKDFTASLTAVNTDVIQNSGIDTTINK